MGEVKVYSQDNSESANFDAVNRGYRSDIYVMKENIFFHVNVYDIVRLQQDFETEVKCYGFFGIDPNIIIVKEVSAKNIKLTIENLDRQKFFENLKPTNSMDFDVKSLVEI